MKMRRINKRRRMVALRKMIKIIQTERKRKTVRRALKSWWASMSSPWHSFSPCSGVFFLLHYILHNDHVLVRPQAGRVVVSHHSGEPKYQEEEITPGEAKSGRASPWQRGHLTIGARESHREGCIPENRNWWRSRSRKARLSLTIEFVFKSNECFPVKF